jgi:hypothetical protein
LDNLTAENWSARQSRRAASREALESEVLCFGDSLVKQGILPRVIEDRCGVRAYNLALGGGQAPSSFFLLRRALERGAKPSAVVVDFWAPLMTSGPRHLLQQWPYLIGYRDAVDLAWHGRDADLLASITLGRILPSIRCRFTLRENVAAALDGASSRWRWEMPWVFRHWNIHRGANVIPNRLPGPVDYEAWRRGYYERWHCEQVNQIYIQRFLELAQAHGIAVYWLLPPAMPGLQAACEQSGYDLANERFVRSWQSRFPGLTVIDGRHAEYDPAVFSDPNHLGRDGAFVFSTEVGRILRAAGADRGPSAWIALPKYQARPVDLPLEDINESKFAVRSRGAARRR